MTQASESSRITPEVVAHLREWEGRSETLVESVTPQPVRGLAATLDCGDAPSALATELPPLWHWLYFTPSAPQRELGSDGHPKVGGFLPPVPLPRRMWAGSRLQWHGALSVGDEVRKTSSIQSVTHKAGRSGDLIFAVVRHELACGDRPILTEEQDIVYRAPAQPGDPAPVPTAAPQDAVWSREIVPDPVLLFRYSALTFNGHRIHYDRPYATGEEGYPGLVVHGPLLATLLAELARQESGYRQFKRFSFKAVRPTCDLHPFRICGKPSADGKSAVLWVQDHEGWLAMKAAVEFE